MKSLIFPALHFAALILVLTYKLKTPFQQFIRTRHQTISEGLNRLKTQSVEAETKKKEIDAKLSSLELEKQKIIAEWKERELQQVRQISEHTKKVLEAMKSEGERNRKALEDSVRSEAVRNMGRLILAQAQEKIIRGLTPEAHQRINARFANELGAAKTSMTESMEA